MVLKKSVIKIVDFLGRNTMSLCKWLGEMGLFFYKIIVALLSTKLKIKKIIYQMQHIGVDSLSVVSLIGCCVGSVLAYQAYIGLHRFGGERFIGPVVFLAMVREFGPVLTSIMVAGRAGSAMTAEIGTMRITEQIDALQTLCINIHQYLMIPRVIASTIIMPFLSVFCSLCGIIGGYIVSIYMLNVNPEMYMRSVRENVVLFDITSGLIKATFFGLLLGWIASYKGFTTSGGAKGVGISTTQSVVYICVSIFIADYILTALMF